MLLDSFYFASFIFFLAFTIRPGNIFDFYKYYLIDKFYVGDSPQLLKHDLYQYKEAQIDNKWFKVLGGCLYCYQFWLAIPYYFLVVKKGIIFFIIFVSVNYVWLKLFRYVESNIGE